MFDQDSKRVFIVELTITGIVVFTLAVGIGAVMGADPGSMADWVAAISTLAAFIAAVVAGWYAAKVYQIEERRDSRLERDRASAQAELVAAWFGHAQFATRRPGGTAMAIRDAVYLRNASQLPVTNLEYKLYYGGFPCGKRDHGLLPPCVDPIQIEVSSALTTLELELDGAPLAMEIPGEKYEVWITFRDSLGRDWNRAPHGALHEGRPDWAGHQLPPRTSS